TSEAYTGNLGGLSGADSICMYHAELAALPGIFRAWLSSSTLAAKDRLTHVGKPYVLVDDTVVAYDWTDLVDGSIQHNIDLNEIGGPPAPGSYNLMPLVWTSTYYDGGFIPVAPNTPPSGYSCWDWTV